jgi:hypothetical protein
MSLVDGVMRITTAQAMETARDAALKDGLLVRDWSHRSSWSCTALPCTVCTVHSEALSTPSATYYQNFGLTSC